MLLIFSVLGNEFGKGINSSLFIVESMPTLDLAMPTALLLVVLTALFLNKRAEKKLMATVDQKEFKTRDILLLLVFISVMVSVIAYTSMVNPGGLFPNVLLVLFLSSYVTLLFTFSYVFSGLKKTYAQLISVGFGLCSLVAGLLSLIEPLADSYTNFRVIAFIIFSLLCFGVAVYEQIKSVSKQRWYIAAQPPALFVLLFLFFTVFYTGSINVWFPALLDVFAFTFAILIIMYLSSMFTWKTVSIFAILLTLLDIVLVFSGPMVAAAETFTGLGLPVLVYLPNIPLILNEVGGFLLSAPWIPISFAERLVAILSETGGFLVRGLGLGDFFFAGILAVQTYKKFGQKTAIISIVAMALSFGIWEAFLPEITGFFNIRGFPATVCIITGWIPIILWKLLTTKNKASSITEEPVQPPTGPLT